MNSKADLKTAREAIGAKNFTEAVKACKRVLLWEGENYNAWVFLGVAHTGLENDEEAEEAYKRAIDISPENMLGWHGLVSFYEKRNKPTDLAETIKKLLPRIVESGDGAKLADYLKKLLKAYKESGSDTDYFEILKQFLPGSQYYELVQSQPDLPPQIDIWKYIIEKLEKEQTQKIESEVASRRFRVSGDTPAQVQAQVETEIFAVSELGTMYGNVLDLIPEEDEQEKLVWKLKLLKLYAKKLLGVKEKAELNERVMSLAKELIDVNDPIPLEILIESANTDSPEKYDWTLFDKLIDKFPDSGLAKLGKGYKLSKQGDIDGAFDLLSDGLNLCPNSLFGYQCLSRIYYDSKEYETGLEYATKGKDLVIKAGQETGVFMSNVLLSLEICMAHCYRLLDKKYYIDATTLYKSILQRYPDNSEVLEGFGLILIEEKKLDEALANFEKVQQLQPQNHKALAEIGWIHCEKGNYDLAVEFISNAIELDGSVADYYYRLGRIYWDMGDSANAFKHFMHSVKLDPYFASGFTYLGHYYRKTKSDHIRAKKCYQKAYVLNPLDTNAAFYLSDYHVTDGQESEAETIFRNVSDTCPKTGWAWRRMGYLNMNSSSFNEAIVCFQKALRTDTSDVRCWEGLAESYSKAGRFVAALKAFGRATTLDPKSVHASNEHAYVQQKVGLLDDAIIGFKRTLELASQQGKPNYIPALAGLAETYLEKAKEDFQAGFFGRASDCCNLVFKTSLLGLQHDATIIAFWKLVGDACAFYRQIPSYLNNCDYSALQSITRLTVDANKQLKFESDITSHWTDEFLALDDLTHDFSLPHKTALDVILSCAATLYKQSIVLCKNHQSISPAFWHDIAIMYYHISVNNNSEHEALVAIKCVKVALKLEPGQYVYWNTLGVIAMTATNLPKISQYAFTKAMEFNNRSAIPWTNYGFLCLSLHDYELANQAFEMAHSLDPEWISAWVGQAYVASLWGKDAAAIFEHAFDSSNGSAMDASYGYAETVYQNFSSSTDNTAFITPVFALEKLTEQKLNNALALNLLGLLLERLGQYSRAAGAFASAILVVEGQLEEDTITVESGQERLSKIRANLSRTLCASGDFETAITTDPTPQSVYSQLNAGIAFYFQDKLSESLKMFELALNSTQEDVVLRQDVVVLLSKVLWALGGEEQRQVAKDQLFSSITQNPNYLPAIFSLCVMGILENDETLTGAALQELAKVSVHIAYENDKEQSISYLFSKFYEIQGNNVSATRALVKNIHQTPWLAQAWSRLSVKMVKSNNRASSTEIMTESALVLANSKSRTAAALSEAYEDASLAQMNSNLSLAKKNATRSVISAPWRLTAWQTLSSISKA